MRPIGRRAPKKHTVEGHQNCGICHPKDDGNRAREKRRSEEDWSEDVTEPLDEAWKHEEGLTDGVE